ncbi:MAG: (d)CMP kinase [Planctomycetota bacterium]|nr:(d)CMP kinase [Planctomycetota bacterium]
MHDEQQRAVAEATANAPERPLVVAIDGPAGAGKSTVARGLAAKLGLRFLDTGAMYRAVTLLAIEAGIAPSDAPQLTALCEDLELDFDPAGQVVVDGRCLEPEIRRADVTGHVSEVSAQPGVRAAIVARQQEFGRRWEGLVAEGRDTTTVVFPDASHRFYLDASPAERARRRALELGVPDEVDRIQAEIELRDGKDSGRAHSPLIHGDGVELVQTDGLEAEGVIEALLELVRGGGVQP